MSGKMFWISKNDLFKKSIHSSLGQKSTKSLGLSFHAHVYSDQHP